MGAQNRGLIEQTLFNLCYDMDRVGADAEIWEQIRGLTDDDLITVFNDFVGGME